MSSSCAVPRARGTPGAGEEPVVGSWGGHDDLIHLGEAGRPLTSSQYPLPSNAERLAPPQLPRFWIALRVPSLLPVFPSSFCALLPLSFPHLALFSHLTIFLRLLFSAFLKDVLKHPSEFKSLLLCLSCLSLLPPMLTVLIRAASDQPWGC